MIGRGGALEALVSWNRSFVKEVKRMRGVERGAPVNRGKGACSCRGHRS